MQKYKNTDIDPRSADAETRASDIINVEDFDAPNGGDE